MQTKTQSFGRKARKTRKVNAGFEKAKAFALAMLVTVFMVGALTFVATNGVLALTLVGAGAMVATTALPFVAVKTAVSVMEA